MSRGRKEKKKDERKKKSILKGNFSLLGIRMRGITYPGEIFIQWKRERRGSERERSGVKGRSKTLRRRSSKKKQGRGKSSARLKKSFWAFFVIKRQ